MITFELTFLMWSLNWCFTHTLKTLATTATTPLPPKKNNNPKTKTFYVVLLFEGYSKILPPSLFLALCAESTPLCCCSNSVNWFLYFYFYWKRNNTNQPHLSLFNIINITRDYFKTDCWFSFSSNTGLKYFWSLSTNIHSDPYSIITYASLCSFILTLFRFVFSRDISDDC